MKNAKVWLCVLLSVTMLLCSLPAAAEDATITVPCYTAYERAERAGMYVAIALGEKTEYRMKTRLGQIVAANQDRFDEEKTASSVIKGWFDSTHTNFGTLFTLSLSDEGTVQIEPDYLAVYDFIAISDAEGRAMLYPFQQYSFDLYQDVCEASVPVMQEMLTPLMDTCFAAIMETLTDEDMKNQLEVAYDELKSTFSVTIDDAKTVLLPDTALSDTDTLTSALSTLANISVGDLGSFKTVPVATTNTDAVWYKLSLANGQLTGSKLASPVALSEIRNTTTAAATLWLNENGELVYLTAAADYLSADAAQLTSVLLERGGDAVSVPVEEKTESASGSNVVWYIIAALAVLALAAAWYFLVHKKAGRTR